ncbi:MAG: hypothetical protein H0W02_12900 [Ktedonobacteraceae bacterium]|nr:hypothetical protein [Ktedonobacteraceae bacterium]
MAGWERELAELLRELGVTLEEPGPQTHLQTMQRSMHRDAKRREPAVDALTWGDTPDDDDDAWLTDLRLMRREVDSIVTQVIRLMQRGDLDTASKEDVMVVLRALRRRAAGNQQGATSDEAYLEFAAAMLHFCRLVLRLSEAAIED